MKYSIGDVASELGISASTIRYYETEGLIPRAVRRSGRRIYLNSDVDSIRLVLLGRALGLGISELKALRSAFSPHDEEMQSRRQAMSRLLARTNETIARLDKQRALLEQALDCDCVSHRACQLTA